MLYKTRQASTLVVLLWYQSKHLNHFWWWWFFLWMLSDYEPCYVVSCIPMYMQRGAFVSCSVPIDHKQYMGTACPPQLANHLAEEMEVQLSYSYTAVHEIWSHLVILHGGGMHVECCPWCVGTNTFEALSDPTSAEYTAESTLDICILTKHFAMH